MDILAVYKSELLKSEDPSLALSDSYSQAGSSFSQFLPLFPVIIPIHAWDIFFSPFWLAEISNV